MGRAERRRKEKLERKSKEARDSIDKALSTLPDHVANSIKRGIETELQRVKQEATDDAINTAMVLLLTLPLTVLMEHYWKKSYAKRLPKFIELLLEYYEHWQNDELDMEEMKKNLWEYGGVRLEESE